MERAVLRRYSPVQEKRMERNKKLIAEYRKIMADKEQSRIEAMRYLAEKYNLSHIQSVYKIIRKEGGSI